MSKRSENFLKGFYDVLPLLLPVVPFGIIFGAIGVELGFGPYVTYATSIIIFSGASQIVFFQLAQKELSLQSHGVLRNSVILLDMLPTFRELDSDIQQNLGQWLFQIRFHIVDQQKSHVVHDRIHEMLFPPNRS